MELGVLMNGLLPYDLVIFDYDGVLMDSELLSCKWLFAPGSDSYRSQHRDRELSGAEFAGGQRLPVYPVNLGTSVKILDAVVSGRKCVEAEHHQSSPPYRVVAVDITITAFISAVLMFMIVTVALVTARQWKNEFTGNAISFSRPPQPLR